MVGKRVYISGAGPVGMVVAVGLCQRGVPVTVFEAGGDVCQDLRASYYHAPSVDMLENIGYLDKLLEGGTKDINPRFTDVALGRQVIFDLSLLSKHYRNPYAVNAGQNWFTKVGHELLTRLDCEFLFNHRVLSATQDADQVTISVDTPNGHQKFSTDWLIACDGGGSKIRASQDIPFEGFTWQDRFLLIHTKHDLEPRFGRLDYRANGPQWCLVIRIPHGPGGNDWMYRVVSGLAPHEKAENIQDPAFCQARLQDLLPSDTAYPIDGASVYNVHQQVAQRYRKGRILLAGDAAHMNNPIGGQGLNCGIHDAFNLIEKFVPVWSGIQRTDVLDLYDRQRRLTNWEYIQKISIENKKRNEETDLEKRAKVMDTLSQTVTDDERHRAFLHRWSMGESLEYAASIQ